ncbi:mitochondrial import inner membrane translocase [Trichuris trichiura]|uniref:Mitochondrial import inner membrane translocase subunit n=1 Tax=Trichuris trichiura TaxID=36087 RepID=A0A077ZD00_TRITR|nr:mitochondrial import inner membrane translocase [Trichuris trichiura]
MGSAVPLDPNNMQLVAELELEMMTDLYRRMTTSCQKKCIPGHYKEPDLSKGEAVCIDRCVAKYLDVHEKLGKKLTQMSSQDDQVMQKLQQQMQGQS